MDSLKVKLLNENAKLPIRGSVKSAGLDLFASEDTVVPAHKRMLIPTGIAVKIPSGCYGRIAPRSGNAVKYMDVGAGVVDEDYRGEVKVLLVNMSDKDLTISKHFKVAQFILERCLLADVVQVDSLDETERGEGGFGSTGDK